MSTILANNDEFRGDINNAVRTVTVDTGNAATVQKQAKAADGTISWVNITDGALTGPAQVTMYATPNAKYRVTSVTGVANLE